MNPGWARPRHSATALGGIDDPASEIREFWIDNRDQLLVGSLLQALALPPYLVFVLALREVLGRGGEEGVFWGRVMAAGAVIAITLAAAGGALGLSVAWIEGSTEEAGDDVVRAVWNAGTLPFLAAGAALFAFAGAAALGILRTKVLPVWTGWLGGHRRGDRAPRDPGLPRTRPGHARVPRLLRVRHLGRRDEHRDAARRSG